MMFGLSILRLGIYAAIALSVAGGLYGGWRIVKHNIWVSGRDAALEAVAAQNSVAAEAARKVEFTIDHCLDQGGSWDVVTGSCIL